MYRILHIPTNTFLVRNLRCSGFLESLVTPTLCNSHNITDFRYHFSPKQFCIAEFSNEPDIEKALHYFSKRYPNFCLLELVTVEY